MCGGRWSEMCDLSVVLFCRLPCHLILYKSVYIYIYISGALPRRELLGHQAEEQYNDRAARSGHDPRHDRQDEARKIMRQEASHHRWRAGHRIALPLA